ncbi:MAG: hypothetical protein CK547_03990 [Chitinophagaceae bacterium]|nr:MAG: hypothetical protein CK547_03990 [Chitinophagaceae bacterium]
MNFFSKSSNKVLGIVVLVLLVMLNYFLGLIIIFDNYLFSGRLNIYLEDFTFFWPLVLVIIIFEVYMKFYHLIVLVPVATTGFLTLLVIDQQFCSSIFIFFNISVLLTGLLAVRYYLKTYDVLRNSQEKGE